MKKGTLFWILSTLLGLGLLIAALYLIEDIYAFIAAIILRLFLFAKQHIIAIFSAFFLVKGKFVLTLFLKKIALLSATGLGKRYFIEKVLTHNIKIHFLDHIRDDLIRLANYIKKNFKRFPIVKQVIAIIAFLSSLGFVGKFMGWMIAIKVFVAKFWSFLLALFLKTGTAVIYFFTDYIWGSWIAPIVEVVIFSWLLKWLEKIPFLKGFFERFYRRLSTIFAAIEEFVEKVFHIPMKRFFAYLAKWVKHWIDEFMDEKKLSSWQYLQELRTLNPNGYQKLQKRRQARKNKNRKHRSTYEKLKEKRLKRAR